MYDILKSFHSHNRNLVLLLLVIAILLAIVGLVSKKTWSKFNKIFSLLGMIITDIQFLIGMILYFAFSPLGIKAFSNDNINVMKDAVVRKIAVEHLVLMLAAWILIHIGYSKVKKSANPHKSILIYYGLGLVLILAGIPWGKLV